MFTTSNELENNTGENSQCAENIIEYYGGGMLFRRWLATLIDFILLGSLIFFLVGISNLLGDRIFAKTVFIWVILLVCIFVCYHFIQEAITGYTIGKFIMRIKVVDSKCDAPGLKKAIIRTLFRIIEINPLIFGGIPAGIAVLTSKKKQRIGDAVANTYVVRCCDINRKNDSNIKKRISLFIALFTILAIIIGGIGFYNTIGKSIIDNMNFRTFIGSDNKTQITCPSNWEKMKVEKLFSKNSEVKLYAVRADGRGSILVIKGVNKFNKNIDPKDFVKTIQKYEDVTCTFSSATEPKNISINKYNATQFEMDVKYGQIGKKVLASIIQTPDDVYTIIGDSLDNKANIDEFYSIEGSFKQVQK